MAHALGMTRPAAASFPSVRQRFTHYYRLALLVLLINGGVLWWHVARGDWRIDDGSALSGLTALTVVNFAPVRGQQQGRDVAHRPRHGAPRDPGLRADLGLLNQPWFFTANDSEPAFREFLALMIGTALTLSLVPDDVTVA